jgi:tetratricopeptide (TPR) repeat protein
MTLVMALVFIGVVSGQAPAPASQAASPPGDAEDLVKQARDLVRAGQIEEGLAEYRKALALKPDSPDANLGAGIALDLLQRFDEAGTHLSKALAVAPDEMRGQVLTALGVSYAFQGKAREAATFYQQNFDKQMASSNFADAAATANGLGRVFLETGDVANATRWYQTGYEAARRQPESPGAQLKLWEFRWLHAQGRIAARGGQIDKAREHVAAARSLLEQGNELKDEWPTWYYLAGYVELYARQYDKAIELLKQADQRDPFVLALLAESQQGVGQVSESRDTWQRVRASTAHNLQNAFARGKAIKALGK